MPKISTHIDSLSEKLGPAAHVSAAEQEQSDVVVQLTAPTPAALKKLLTDQQWTSATLTFDPDAGGAGLNGPGGVRQQAEWLPWFDISQDDAGEGPLTWRLTRRSTPLLEWNAHQAYQHLVERIYSGKGRGIGRIAALAVGPVRARAWMQEADVRPDASAARLTAEQWVMLYRHSHDDAGRPASGHSVGPARKVNHASGQKGGQVRKVRW